MTKPNEKTFARFFTVGGDMQWSSETEESLKRIVWDPDERDQFLDERDSLNRVGGWIMLPSCVIVRTA